MQYKYTLLKQDGTKEDLGIGKKKEFKELYKVLGCSMIEVIPKDYYPQEYKTKCVIFGDEEGRFNEKNQTNPHMLAILDLGTGQVWDTVGDLVVEEKVK